MRKIPLKNVDIQTLSDIMSEFGKGGTIFQSEAQFQFELAWKLQEKIQCKANLEVLTLVQEKENSSDKDNKKQKIYTDIVLEENGYSIAIELKYKTAELEADNPYAYLLNHGAADLGRYDYLWDVNRLEVLLNSMDKKTKHCDKGFAILLTNDKHYWEKKWEPEPTINKKITIDNQFKIGIQDPTNKTGKLFGKVLEWRRNPDGQYTTAIQNDKARSRVIELNHIYQYEWKEYCNLEIPNKNGEFRFVIIEATR